VFNFVFAIVVSLIFFVSSAIIIPPFFMLSLTGPAMIARYLLTRYGRLDKPGSEHVTPMLPCISSPFRFTFMVKMSIAVEYHPPTQETMALAMEECVTPDGTTEAMYLRASADFAHWRMTPGLPVVLHHFCDPPTAFLERINI
jgi:hypothetical protein